MPAVRLYLVCLELVSAERFKVGGSADVAGAADLVDVSADLLRGGAFCSDDPFAFRVERVVVGPRLLLAMLLVPLNPGEGVQKAQEPRQSGEHPVFSVGEETMAASWQPHRY